MLTYGYEQSITLKEIPDINQYKYLHFVICNATNNVELAGRTAPIFIFKTFPQYIEQYQNTNDFINGVFSYNDDKSIHCQLNQGSSYAVDKFFYYVYGIE